MVPAGMCPGSHYSVLGGGDVCLGHIVKLHFYRRKGSRSAILRRTFTAKCKK